MYVRESSKKRKYLIVKLLRMSSSDRSLYVLRCRCSGCINRWDVLINTNWCIVICLLQGSIFCRWISCRKNTGYHAMDPNIRTQGAERGRSWIATKHGDGSLELSNAQRTAERDTELYPGSGPSWWGKTPTSCLLVLQRDTSRGVQGLGYRALTGRR
jgi:hypothetical protein